MLASPMSAHAIAPARQAPASDAARPAGPKTAAGNELVRFVAASGGSVPVTLITGDTVDVGVEDGKPVVLGTKPVPRPDGLSVVLRTFTRQGKVYAVPDDALPLVGQGVLDWSLFDLEELLTLVAAGRHETVPVLVGYTGTAAADRTRKVAGASGGRELPSINGRSLKISDGGQWWRGVRGKEAHTAAAARSAGSLAGVKKVWLNGMSHIDLEQSVPQTGAPVAWERGYDGSGVTVAVLDTGIDATHPDVSASIAGQADFTGGSPGARDGHGHGTHVASTVLGSGAASKGLRKGVAPGARLLVGKVCNDQGECPDDAVIAGMDWAAHSGAKVVNMSLGGEPTDGTDPMSQALNELSRSTGTLFVVAAGNSGLVAQKVVSPGSADDALTVAAVDKSDAMASFSNQGPRVGDGAAKPDIAAPGVDIVAARAAGTSMGRPVDQYYTASDGTSMATPHVTGAAAVIAQQRPELTGQQIKALLMSTAGDLGHDMYAQGTGLVDLATATNPRIVPKGNLNFGRMTPPHAPVTKKITYTNAGDSATTLRLTLEASFADGRPAAAGLVTTATDQVVVPANGSVEVPVTIDPAVLGTPGPYGAYDALLHARDDSGAIRLTSRVHTFIEPEKFPLTLNVIPPPGAKDVQYGKVVFLPVDDQIHLHSGPAFTAGADSVTTQLFRGTYAVQVPVTWRNEEGELQQALPMAPQVSLTEATTATLDLRKAQPLRVRYPEPTETYNTTDRIERVSATGAWALASTYAYDYRAAEANAWVLPTAEVSMGELTHDFYSSGATPVVTLRATGGGTPFGLSARYVTPDATLARSQGWPYGDGGDLSTRQAAIPVPRLPVGGRLPVVYAGAGTTEEFKDIDARGKLVLLTPTDLCRDTCDYPRLRDERVAAAASAGAVGVLVSAPGLTSLGVPPEFDVCPDGPQSCPAIQPYAALPVVSVPHTEAKRLIERIGSGGSRVRIDLRGSAVPRAYAATYHDDGRIEPDSYRLGKRDLDRVDLSFHAEHRGVVHQLSWNQPIQGIAASSQVSLPQPSTQRSVSVFVKRENNAISRFTASWADTGADYFIAHNRTEKNDLVLTGRDEIHWNAGPSVPGAVSQARTRSGFSVQAGPCAGCRQGDTFYPTVYLTGAGGGRQQLIGIVGDETLQHEFIDIPSCGATPSPTVSNLDSSCDFTLRDASGKEYVRHKAPLPDQNLGLGL
ncbi:S8 family peptidase [Streptomyces sp. NPDC097727]|uniref:S8 family peptidase n=1 Tax=Streptomyces sp. NPDC097727 TaxID=3366092 RepID=UPI003819514D